MAILPMIEPQLDTKRSVTMRAPMLPTFRYHPNLDLA